MNYGSGIPRVPRRKGVRKIIHFRGRGAQGVQHSSTLLGRSFQPGRQLLHGLTHVRQIGTGAQRIVGNQLAALDGLQERVV